MAGFPQSLFCVALVQQHKKSSNNATIPNATPSVKFNKNSKQKRLFKTNKPLLITRFKFWFHNFEIQIEFLTLLLTQ
jgi:hypothetical protein